MDTCYNYLTTASISALNALIWAASVSKISKSWFLGSESELAEDNKILSASNGSGVSDLAEDKS